VERGSGMFGFILKEIFMGWKNNLKSNTFMLLLCIIGITGIGAAITLNSKVDEQADKFKEKYEDVQFYTISDNFLGDKAIEISDINNKGKFAEFLNLLNSSDYFDYFMMYENPVNIENYAGKESNIYGYEYSSDVSDHHQVITHKDGVERECTGVKGFLIGDYVIDYFNLELKEGKVFEANDFVLNSDKPISVILGSNYADEYCVGDKIFVSYLFAEQEAEIIGFLKEGTNVFYRDSYTNLDRYIIVPIFVNDDCNGEEIYNIPVNYIYSVRTSGVIATRLSSADIKEIIESYSKEAGFITPYYVVEYDPTEKVTFGVGIQDIQFIITLIVILAVCASVITLTLCLVHRIEISKRYYAILMMNGCSGKEILCILLGELFFILLISFLIGCIVTVLVSGQFIVKVMKMLLLGSCLFGLMPGIISAIIFLKSDLVRYMYEEI